jgi:hypothetical protein
VKNVFTTERIVSWIARALPTADEVNWIKIRAENVRFEWRGKEFRITCGTMLVEKMNGDIVISSDEADLIERLLKKQFAIEHSAPAADCARMIEVEQLRLEDLRREAYPPLHEVQQEHLRMLHEMEHGGVADISAFNLRSSRF